MKKLTAALGISLVWGAAWAVGSVGLATVLTWLGVVSVPLNPEELFQIGTWYGLVGIVAGGTFSSLLPIAFPRRDVLSLRPVSFLVGGTAAGVLLGPLLPGPIWLAALLGAGTSGGTLALAKSAARRELAGETVTDALAGEAS